VDGWHTACKKKQKIKWRTEMRKMKKFLAATLVSAMVLSMAVPAMAATGEPASNTQTAIDTESWNKAVDELSKKQKAYDDAELALKTAQKALDKLLKEKEKALKELQEKAGQQKVTAEDLKKEEDAAKSTVYNLETKRQQAASALNQAKKAEEKVAPAKTAKDAAEKEYDALKKAYDKNEKDPGYDPIQLTKDKEALNKAEQVKDKRTQEYNTAVSEAQALKDLADGYQAEVDKTI
jgi:chromosome segregation ATPase